MNAASRRDSRGRRDSNPDRNTDADVFLRFGIFPALYGEIIPRDRTVENVNK